MSDQSVDFQLGALSARADQMEARQAALEATIDRRLSTIESRVNVVHDVITSGKGGWKAMTVLGAFAAAVSGFVLAILHWVWPR